MQQYYYYKRYSCATIVTAVYSISVMGVVGISQLSSHRCRERTTGAAARLHSMLVKQTTPRTGGPKNVIAVKYAIYKYWVFSSNECGGTRAEP